MHSQLSEYKALLSAPGRKRDAILLAGGGLFLLLSLLNSRFRFLPLPFDLVWGTILLCGVPILREAATGLFMRFDIKADVLVSLALVASVCIHEDFAAGEVAFIMRLGSLLEELTVARARAGIEKLARLVPQEARVLVAGEEIMKPSGQVVAGDRIRVLPGETIPADGVILSGQTSVNQAVMTGESLPVDKGPGDEVTSGTINQCGAFEMRASVSGGDNAIRRMIRLVEAARADKAAIVGLADCWATWIVILALSFAAFTWFYTGEATRAVTVLVVFCPCALVLATPTAVMAAIGNATAHGFLVREGDALERLAQISHVTFDKTGTLTSGIPVVSAVETMSGLSPQEIYALAASAETYSEHPLGKAVAKCYGEKADVPERFSMTPGEGVSAVVRGQEVAVGNERLLARLGLAKAAREVRTSFRDYGTAVYVAVGNRLAGYIVLTDTLRREAAAVIHQIREMGIVSVLLTGDRTQAATPVAQSLGIGKISADCRPEDKMKVIRQMQDSGHLVCMIGDGVNDAPALKAAHVGIAMGGAGSDIAVDAADIALVDDEIKELPHLLALARRMMRTIKMNLAFSLALNIVAVILAATGWFGPVIGALVHNAGSVLVILHSALLLTWRMTGRD